MEVFIFFIFAMIVVAALAWQFYASRKRREAMAALAAKLGLQFSPAKDRQIAKQYNFLNRLHRGSNRYAFNILYGRYREQEVTIFDFHYQVQSGKNTHHYFFSFFILLLTGHFPELTIAREGFFSKVAQAVGFDDIDFESHEFSRRFCVRSRDKKFAYDVCNGRMIEYLLANRDLSVEIENNVLAVGFDRRLEPEQVEWNLGRLLAIRERMPDYLFAGGLRKPGREQSSLLA